ncbi:MAG: Hpt domain-containing protein [Chitinophagales bacterium]
MINYTKLFQLLGDKEMVDKYMALVQVEIPKELDQLKRHLNAKNYTEASVVAHSIKSQCQYMGLDACAELALKIERQTESLIWEIDPNNTFIDLEAKLQQILSE